MAVEIRTLNQNEIEAAYWLGKYAFGQWRDQEMQPEDYQWINPQQTVAAFVDGQLAAKVATYPFTQMIRGVEKPMGGVASVATYPEFRRRGLVRQLMHASFTKMRENKFPISALYPFNEQFYDRLGYVTTNNILRVKVETKALAHHMPLIKQDMDSWSYERKRAADHKTEWLAHVRKWGQKHHGFVFFTPETMADVRWKLVSQDQHLLYIKHSGEIMAAARFLNKGYMEGGEITVREIYWRTPEARDRLLAYFATHTAESPHTWLPVPYGTNFHSWINGPTERLQANFSFVVLMGRIIEVSGALANLPAPVEGSLIFALTDAQCEWNNGRFLLQAINGRLSAIPTSQSADIHMTQQGLSALIYGALPVAEVAYRGWITGLNDRIKTRLDAWFPGMILYNTNHF